MSDEEMYREEMSEEMSGEEIGSGRNGSGKKWAGEEMAREELTPKQKQGTSEFRIFFQIFEKWSPGLLVSFFVQNLCEVNMRIFKCVFQNKFNSNGDGSTNVFIM
jgi:hypothetical protein